MSPSHIPSSKLETDDDNMNVAWPMNTAPFEPPQPSFTDCARLLEAMEDSVEFSKAELLRIRIEREIDSQIHNEEVDSLNTRLATTRNALEIKLAEMNEDVALHQYAKVLKNNKMPTYILVLQAKVLRNLHHFCIADAQLKLVQKQSAELISAMKEHRLDLMFEQSQVQKEGLNYMVQLQMEDEELSTSFSHTMRRQSEEMIKLHELIGLNDSFFQEDCAVSRPAQPRTLDELICKLDAGEDVSSDSVLQFLKLDASGKNNSEECGSSCFSSFSFAPLKAFAPRLSFSPKSHQAVAV